MVVKYSSSEKPFFLAEIKSVFDDKKELLINWYDTEKDEEYQNGPSFPATVKKGSDEILTQMVSTECVIVRFAQLDVDNSCKLSRSTMIVLSEMRAELNNLFIYRPHLRKMIRMAK